MTKAFVAILFAVVFMFPLLYTGCSVLEPDREFIYSDTTIIDDTIKIHDTTKIYADTLRYHDTTKIHDTIRIRDTIRIHDTLKTTVHDTFEIHDTIRIFSTTTNSTSLVGAWQGNVNGTSITLSIFDGTGDEMFGYEYDFTANIGTKAYDGFIKSFSGNIAAVDISGPSAYGEEGSWIFSIKNNVLTLQQTGYSMFPSMQAFNLNRIQ